jgi:hypothetical protein
MPKVRVEIQTVPSGRSMRESPCDEFSEHQLRLGTRNCQCTTKTVDAIAVGYLPDTGFARS